MKTLVKIFFFVLCVFLFVIVSEQVVKIGDQYTMPPPVSPTEYKTNSTHTTKSHTTRLHRTHHTRYTTLVPREFKKVSRKIPWALKARLNKVRSGLLIDLNSKKILWERKKDTMVPIASMTKMMTMLLCMEKVKSKKVKLKDRFRVPKSVVYNVSERKVLEYNDLVTLESLCKAAMIYSANDAAYMIGEIVMKKGNKLGSVKEFVGQMNRKAKQLGMKAHYYNPNGLPYKVKVRRRIVKKEASATAMSMAQVAFQLMKFPDILRWTSTARYRFSPLSSKRSKLLKNTNSLVNHGQGGNSNSGKGCRGVTGMKTGFTNAARSCITVTCERNGRKMIAVVTGMSSATARNKLVKDLLDWGYKTSF